LLQNLWKFDVPTIMASDLPALLFSFARQKPGWTFSIDYNANAKLLDHSKLKVQQLLNGKMT
jgi:hypothetical protein